MEYLLVAFQQMTWTHFEMMAIRLLVMGALIHVKLKLATTALVAQLHLLTHE